jgi:hypothetical protein
MVTLYWKFRTNERADAHLICGFGSGGSQDVFRSIGVAIMSKNIKQPIPSKQNTYTAAVRFFLGVSRGYLAAPDTAILPPN